MSHDPCDQAQAFYDKRHKKHSESVYYCDECEKETRHSDTEGHNGLDSFSYSVCKVCGDTN